MGLERGGIEIGDRWPANFFRIVTLIPKGIKRPHDETVVGVFVKVEDCASGLSARPYRIKIIVAFRLLTVEHLVTSKV